MHNIVHNMDDEEMGLPIHVTLRNGVFQYVRRVPEDVAHAFSAPRIQRSLRTRDPSDARLRAAQIDIEIERQFAEARAKQGVVLTAVVSEGWKWPEWEQFVAWFRATLIEEDTQARLSKLRGRQLAHGRKTGPAAWLPDALLRERLDLKNELSELTVQEYCDKRLSFVQSFARRLGVSVPSTSPYFERIMGACFAAELEALEVTFEREGGQWTEHLHPDAVQGEWTKAPHVSSQALVAVKPASVAEARTGTKLAQLVDTWIEERTRLKKKVDQHLVTDMRKTVERFSKLTGQSDIGLIERRHVIEFRDHLADESGDKVATINKKTGFITSLISLAAGKGWVDKAIEGGIFIDIPSDEDQREPYSLAELDQIFSHPMFTAGQRSGLVKSCNELQFWLPLISVTHGLISSEILQLGPDTICRHPDADIWCFRVTTAGGRSIKSFARERFVPIRKEVADLGLLELAEQAQQEGRSSLWSVFGQEDWTVSKASNYFSDFWSRAQSKGFKIEAADKSLYSLRHSFKDALDRSKTPLEVKQALLGHTDPGTTGRYGSKKQPRQVNIKVLSRTIQKLDWRFLSSLRTIEPKSKSCEGESPSL
jgi:integrase